MALGKVGTNMQSKVSDEQLVQIRNKLAVGGKFVRAWQIRDEIKKSLGLDLDVSTIRGRFLSMGMPLSKAKGVVTGEKLPEVQGVDKPRDDIPQELLLYVPKEEEFVGYIERDLDSRLALHYDSGMHPISQGPQGSGKTFSHAYYAFKKQLPFFLFSGYEDFNLVKLFGDKTIKNGSVVYQESLFVKAIQAPSVILFDEVNAISNQNTYDFHALLQNRKLYIKDADDGKGKVFEVHPECRIGFAQNPRSAKYIGGNIKSSNFLGRCTYLTYPEFTGADVIKLINKRFGNLQKDECKAFQAFYENVLKTLAQNDIPVDISIRQLCNTIDLYNKGMPLEFALKDGMIDILDAASQSKAKESFHKLAEGCWKELMDIRAGKTIKKQQEEIEVKDKKGKLLKVGEKVRTTKGKEGIIRHLGPLNFKGAGDAVWSEWANPWDGVLAGKIDGGMLMWAPAGECEKI